MGLGEHVRIILFQLVEDFFVVIPRLTVVDAGHVEDDAEGAAPANVAEEGVAKPHVEMCTLNDTGDVADGVALPAVHFHHANLRVQRGEGVGGNLRLGVGDCVEERALAGIGITD